MSKTTGFSVDRPIPPLSVIRLIRRDRGSKSGVEAVDTFRVGYYSKQDGLDVVWLVNKAAVYEQTWDQATLTDHFEIVSLSTEDDLFGASRLPLEPIL